MLGKADSILYQLHILCALIITGSQYQDPSLSSSERDITLNEIDDESGIENHNRKFSCDKITNVNKGGIIDEFNLSNGYTLYKENPVCTKNIDKNKGNLNTMHRCTSVWCHKSNESGLQCRFSNLYYNSQEEEFIFVYCNQSIIYGIKNLKVLQNELYLSSVENHSAFRLSISVIPLEIYAVSYRSKIVFGQSIVMARFKPDNILHVLHDDLLPIYFTSEEICMADKSCQSNLNFIFVDKNDKGKYWHLYKMFSKVFTLISHLSQADKLEWLCFTTAHVGLNKVSIWYDYGYGKPQGSNGRDNFSGHLLRKFTDNMLEVMNIKSKSTKSVQGLLFSRKLNRKIINEEEVLNVIRSSLIEASDGRDTIVKAISEEGNGVYQMIEELTRSHVAVGVHGASLILSMFLPPGSILIEIFPFGINPSAATVYKTMCELRDMGITYVAWANKDLKNSVFHFDYPDYYGGLGHLTLNERENIIQNLKEHELKMVQCCDDPTWLFRIYQDTIVHTCVECPELQSIPFRETLHDALVKSKESMHSKESVSPNMHLYPSKVKDPKCNLESNIDYTKLFVHWKRPWNIENIRCNNIFYEVIMQIHGDANVIQIEVHDEKFLRKVRTDTNAVDLWITCYCNDVEGVELYLNCL